MFGIVRDYSDSKLKDKQRKQKAWSTLNKAKIKIFANPELAWSGFEQTGLGLLRTFAPKSSHAQIFLNLPRRKVMIYYWLKGKKIGGHRLRFGENMPRKIPEIWKFGLR